MSRITGSNRCRTRSAGCVTSMLHSMHLPHSRHGGAILGVFLGHCKLQAFVPTSLQPAERPDGRRVSNNLISALPSRIEQMSFAVLCAAVPLPEARASVYTIVRFTAVLLSHSDVSNNFLSGPIAASIATSATSDGATMCASAVVCPSPDGWVSIAPWLFMVSWQPAAAARVSCRVLPSRRRC